MKFQRLATAALLVTPIFAAQAQLPATGGRTLADVVDGYVRDAFAANLSLRSQTLDVERAIAALDQARGRYFPEVSIEARYSRNEGGREILLPLSQLGAGLSDTSFQFLRETEQDTRLVTRQPLYAPAIPAAVRARQSQLEGVEFARLALARRLKRDVSVSYLDWLRATRNVSIVDASVALLAENLRVNESLHRNGKVTQDQVLRARAELLEVEQQARDARNLVQQARSLLNFLLNRPLETPLEESDIASLDATVVQAAEDLETLRVEALANRPELAQLDRTREAAAAQVDVVRAELKPTLSLGVEGGTQGEDYTFGRGSNFATAGLSFNWRLFDGGANRAAVREARAIARQTDTQRDEIAQQVQLEVQQALDRLDTARDSLATAAARADAARAGFRIASRKRDEGVISQVEFIDARSALTSAEINLNLTRFALLARQAELDYATAAGALPPVPASTGP